MKIAMLCHFTPPVHGAAMVGDLVFRTLKQSHSVHARRLSKTSSLNGIGQVGISGYMHLLIHFFWLFSQIAIRRSSLIYFTPALDGSGWYRDAVLITWSKVIRFLSFNKCRVVLHIHMRPKAGRTKHWAWRSVSKNVELILLSPSLLSDFEYLADNTKVHILPNCVPPAEENVDSKRQPGMLLYLGHISKAKGIYFLLDSLISAMETDSKLKAYSLKVPLSLILTGTLLVSKDEILAKINKLQTLGIACELKGPVYGVEKYALFNRASVFVHASFSEALPLTILEAYSVGLPVVVRRVGGMKDIVMPVTGVFFDNELELVSGVLSVLSNIYDRGTIQSVYRNNYSPDYFSKNLLKIIGS